MHKLPATKTAKAQFSARRISDEDYYEMVAKEMQDGRIRTGLWMKALAESEGDERKAEALYLKLRVASLKNEVAEVIRRRSGDV